MAWVASSALASATASSARATLRSRAAACWSCPSSTRWSLPVTAPATSLALPLTLSSSPSRACAALSLLMNHPCPPEPALNPSCAVTCVSGCRPSRSHGSLSMNRALMAAGLVDRVQVTLFPVLTGQTGAEPIFQGAADFDLELIESRTLDGDTQEL